jgi:hypothetical protein
MCRVAQKHRVVKRMFTEASLQRENLAFSGTPGVSHENRDNGFIPAFCDSETGRVEISRFVNGQPASLHVIEGLPDSWVVERDADSRATAIKHSVIAGFIYKGCFYTRTQAAEAVRAETETMDSE